jgi:hypothetical protein
VFVVGCFLRGGIARVAGEKVDRSRATRQAFVANVIVTEVVTERQITGVIRNLSLFGCYVETAVPFMRGVKAQLTVIHDSQKFTVLGKVVRAEANKGMGITFTSIQPDDQTTLEKWMEKLRRPGDREERKH